MAHRLDNNHLRIMITSGGGPGVWGLLSALRTLPERETTLIVNDPSPVLTLGTGLADVAVRLPDAREPHYGHTLTSLCEEQNVDVLIPVYDGELSHVSAIRAELDTHGTAVLLPSDDVVCTCVDKIATYQRLADTEFVPRFAIANTFAETRSALAMLGSNGQQVCIRPPSSTGSRGLHIIAPDEPSFDERMQRRLGLNTCTLEEFLRWRSAGPEHYPLLITEYLPGAELGLDLLAENGDLVDLVIRRKGDATLHGNPREITFIDDPQITAWAAELANTLRLSALTAIDARYDARGRLKLLEVNARPGAYIGMSCARRHLLAHAIDRLLGIEREPSCYELNPKITAGLRMFADATIASSELSILPTQSQNVLTGALPR